jgi:ABC-type transport system substrate-binding protein
MKRTAYRWLAGISALSVAGIAYSERRPYYGGTLRIEMRAQVRTLDPAQPSTDPAEFAAKAFLAQLVYQPLVRFDEKGEVRPARARAWTLDPKSKVWRFTLDPPSEILLPDDRPIEQLLSEQARFTSAPVSRAADGSIIDATGPFKIARWEPGKSATLIANDKHWEGRPYLDVIEIQMGRSLNDQALDLSVGKADVTETGERKGKLTKTLAIVFDNDGVSSGLREALSLSIDRGTINNVLLKGQGEPSNALLPEWLSGYAFLFSQPRDMGRARQLAAAGPAISFFYDREDAAIRRIAERIAVNAMEAGIMLRSVAAGNADARLQLLPITTNNESSSLSDIAALLKTPFSFFATPYEAERALLDGYRIIPVLHLADSWAVSARVHNWPDLANVWVSPP